MRLLINTSHLNLLSGVSNHYLGLKSFWSYKVTYNSIGSRYGISGIIWLPLDIIKFVFRCLWIRPDVVLLNPSLGKKAIKRDALYLRISSFLKIKTVVFIHGWTNEVAMYYDKNPSKFNSMYQKACGFLVLANDFKQKLRSWGTDAPIYLTTTKVDDDLLSNFEWKDRPINSNILFLARVVKEKGVFVLIHAFQILKKTYPELQLTIAGDGSALADAKAYVLEKEIKNVRFVGRVSGSLLVKEFLNNSIYVLPTSHGEGMPTSVLEAMAFGQAIVTTPIGGVKDFFENDTMGYLIDSYNPEDYSKKISLLIQNPEHLSKVSNFNFNYAKNHFMASKVAKQVEEAIQKMVSKD
ncbi:MAG: glycosyltransferase family 4 protein [Bacteroidota bacterium]